MLLKTTLVALVFTLAPVFAIANQNIHEGGWNDGAAIAWQCQKGAEGKIKFLFKTVDGKIYAGELSCGTGV